MTDPWQPTPEPSPADAPPVDTPAVELPAEDATAPQQDTSGDPAWLIEVRNNIGGIVGAAIEELFKLITGGTGA